MSKVSFTPGFQPPAPAPEPGTFTLTLTEDEAKAVEQLLGAVVASGTFRLYSDLYDAMTEAGVSFLPDKSVTVSRRSLRITGLTD